MVEDYAALEEEGVTGLKKGKYTLREVCTYQLQDLVYNGKPRMFAGRNSTPVL